MKASVSDVMRAVEKALVEMLSDQKKQAVSVDTGTYKLTATRRLVSGTRRDGFTMPVGGREWIDLRIEAEE